MAEFKGIPILEDERRIRSGEKYTTPQGFTAIKDGIKPAAAGLAGRAGGGPQTRVAAGSPRQWVPNTRPSNASFASTA